MPNLNNPINLTNQSSLVKSNEATTKIISLVANEAKLILLPNLDRYSVLVVNLSDNLVSLFEGDSPIAIGKGLPLRRQDSTYSIMPSDLFTGKVTAISSKASELVIVERSL